MNIDLRVLGPVQVLRDSMPVQIGGANPKGVLALLVTARGATVPVPAFIDAIWADRSTTDAANSLHVLISGLRRILGEAIETLGPGYRLALPPGSTDLDRFPRAARDAARTAPLLAERCGRPCVRL